MDPSSVSNTVRTALAGTDDITAIRKRIKLEELTVFETTLPTTAADRDCNSAG
jgi:hypothetical protein